MIRCAICLKVIDANLRRGVHIPTGFGVERWRVTGAALAGDGKHEFPPLRRASQYGTEPHPVQVWRFTPASPNAGGMSTDALPPSGRNASPSSISSASVCISRQDGAAGRQARD